MKSVFAIIALLSSLMACCSFRNSDIGKALKNSKYEFINPEQTNHVEFPVISIDEAKNVIIKNIIANGYNNIDLQRKRYPQYLYMTNAAWGPAVFIESIGTNYFHKYYYLFFLQIPNGSLCTKIAVDAKRAGGNSIFMVSMTAPIDNGKKLYLLPEKDALKYVNLKFNISTNSYIRAINYMKYNPLTLWKYEISQTNGVKFNLKNGKQAAKLYINPFILDILPVPNDTNCNRFGPKRICILNESIHNRAPFESAY